MSHSIPQSTPPGKGTLGIFLIDKPSGITSHDVVDQVRKITGIKRVGHAGTLDPLATGLLIMLVGREYTKQQTSFLKLDKQYRCKAQLGITTDTYDRDGQATDTVSWDELQQLTKQQLLQALDAFKGEIKQTVPPFAAVKRQGQKLYQLARKGKLNEADLPIREVVIKELELLDFHQDEDQQTLTIKLQVTVSSGTYIRSLVHDLGKQLGVGAIVTELRRTKIGTFDLTQASRLTDHN